MKINVIDDRLMTFDEGGWSKAAHYDNDRYLRAMEHLANAYELLKDSAVSLEVGPMFGDDLLIHIKQHL